MFFRRYLKPSFLIIGGVKCASSSLYRYLLDHPSILPSRVKETFFFSGRSFLSAFLKFNSYRRFFPEKKSYANPKMLWYDLNQNGRIDEVPFEKSRSTDIDYITGEASATYNFAAKPNIVKFFLPKVKIIALVRNPSERFISHYEMFCRFHKEGRAGYDLGELIPFIEEEIDKYMNDKETRLLHQGVYVKYLSKWRKVFGKENFFVEKSDSLADENKANSTLNSVVEFLELPAHDFSSIASLKFNVSPVDRNEDQRALEMLNNFYEKYNTAFEEDFGISFSSP